MRTTILSILILLIGFTLYNSVLKKEAEGVELGETAPNFKLETIGGGDPVELSKLKGNVVLVNFWGTWCKPCKDEMPAIQKVYEQYKDDGFEVVAINMGQSEVQIEPFMTTLDINLPIALDKNNSVKDIYNVYRMPASFLIDRDGNVIKSFEGEMNIEMLDSWVADSL